MSVVVQILLLALVVGLAAMLIAGARRGGFFRPRARPRGDDDHHRSHAEASRTAPTTPADPPRSS